MFTNTCRLVCMRTSSLVPRPNHLCEERVWRHLSRFLVLQAQQSCDYLHIFVLTHVMVRRTKKTLQCPQSLFPSLRWGLGTRLSGHPDKHNLRCCLNQPISPYHLCPVLIGCSCLVLELLEGWRWATVIDGGAERGRGGGGGGEFSWLSLFSSESLVLPGSLIWEPPVCVEVCVCVWVCVYVCVHVRAPMP